MSVFLALVVLVASSSPADRPEWDSPGITNGGTEKPHATMMIYPTAEAAKAGVPGSSPWYQSLNGPWKFHGSLRPADRPLEFYRPDFRDASWRTIPVQEDVERAGYTFQMQRHPEVFLNLDWKQMGFGGIDSWSPNALPMAPYRIPSDRQYSYRYRLMPVEGDFAPKTRESF